MQNTNKAVNGYGLRAAGWRGAACAAVVAAMAGAAMGQQPTAPKGPPPASRVIHQPANQPANQASNQGTSGRSPSAGPPGAGMPTPPGEGGNPDDDISLTAFSEAVELTALVDYVAKALHVNVTIVGNLSGSVVFNAPVTVKRGRLMGLLDALLEQQGFTITLDPSGFYTVHQSGNVAFNLADGAPTTKMIPTPNVRPSYLKPAIESQFGTQGGGAGNPGAGAAVPGTQVQTAKGIAYLDEVGVIVVTDTPRRLEGIEKLVTSIIEEYGKAKFFRMDLVYVAAPVARARILELVGQSTSQGGQGGQFINPETGQPQAINPGGSTGRGIDNLAERLTVDPLGNSLFFKGNEGELARIKEILQLIDAQNTLKPDEYYVGSAAKQVADMARLRGLGEVTVISAPQTGNGQPYPVYINNDFNQQNQRRSNVNTTSGGPVMVVDETRGTIVYYGTPEQHVQLKQLIDTLKLEDERVVIREYKLRHSNADEVAELILGLVQNTTPVGSSELLPEDGSGSTGGRSTRRSTSGSASRGRTNPSRTAQPSGGPAEDGSISIADTDQVFVLANKANNQVLIKAPAKMQPEFARLVGKLDLRRPQVYIQAKIVAVTMSEDFRLAFETQLVNANGTGGAFNTNFGLTGAGSSTSITTPKPVSQGLPGFTFALLKSDQVPIVMTALQKNVDTKILSQPQLLVDDNEEASIASVDQQPTTTTSLGDSGSRDVTSFGEYVEAGTTFTVTPQISSGGYLRMEYEIKLSSFTGTGTNGVPPPKQENTVKSKSITVPTGTTVVIGGLEVSTKGNTVVKVPLLGDIPLLGLLFSDTNKNDRKTMLYIFLTPTIMDDPNFDSLRLLTRGPQAASGLKSDEPSMTPSTIEFVPAAQPLNTPPLKPSSIPVEAAPKGGGSNP